MTSLKQFLRQMIAIICGLSLMDSVAGLPVGAVATMTHGGHELATAEHDGHRVLILRHQDIAHAEASPHHTAQLEAHSKHQHGDHIFHLADTNSACVKSATTLLAPLAAALYDCISEFAMPNRSLSQSTKLQPRPPPRLNGVMVCLRTTVLVV